LFQEKTSFRERKRKGGGKKHTVADIRNARLLGQLLDQRRRRGRQGGVQLEESASTGRRLGQAGNVSEIDSLTGLERATSGGMGGVGGHFGGSRGGEAREDGSLDEHFGEK